MVGAKTCESIVVYFAGTPEPVPGLQTEEMPSDGDEQGR